MLIARSNGVITTHALAGRHAANLVAEWHPKTETESQQVDLLALNWWRLLRIVRLENDAFKRPLEIRRQLVSQRESPNGNTKPIPIHPPPDQSVDSFAV